MRENSEPLMNVDIIPATQEDADFLYAQLIAFNKKVLSLSADHIEILKRYIIKDGDVIIAGIDASFYFEEVLYVYALFVDENHRHKKLGTLLLEKVEEETKALGATLVHLDTFDFQAKDFYLKHGYEIFGILEDCPKGHKRYYMKKVL